MARSGLALIPLILVAGAIVLLFFVVLAGITDTTPLNDTYFLSVDRSTLTGSQKGTGDEYWTLWQTCTTDANGNEVCPKAAAAYPFNLGDYVSGNGTSSVYEFLNRSGFYYYTTRFEFAFYLIALTFTVLTFFASLLALCSRLGGAISALFCGLALVFLLTAASLMTAWTVTAKNALAQAGISASLGVKAYGFTWGAVGCLIVSFFFYCGVCCSSRNRAVKEDYVATDPAVTTTPKRRFWQRREKVPFDSEHAANGSY